jgi:hypothetical protein
VKRITNTTQRRPPRVRHEPPTIGEALAAARCIADDNEQQVEIAAVLIGLPAEQVRQWQSAQHAHSRKRLAEPRAVRQGATFTVERKPRRVLKAATPGVR